MMMDNVKIIAFLYTTSILVGISFNIPTPFLSKETSRHGSGKAISQVLINILPFSAAIFTIFSWQLMSRVGVTGVANTGLILAGFSTAVLGCIEFIPVSYTQMYNIYSFFFRILQSVGISAALNAAVTYLVDAFDQHYTLVLTVFMTMNSIGMAVGPVIGEGLVKMQRFWLLLVSSGVTIMLTALLMFLFLPKHDPRTKEKPSLAVPYKTIVLNPRMMISLAVLLFSGIRWASINPLLEPELNFTYGALDQKNALMFLLLSLAFIAGPIAGKTVGQPYCMDSLLVMVIGLTLSTVIYMIAGPSPPLQIPKRLNILIPCIAMMGLTNCLMLVPALEVIFNTERIELPADMNTTAVRAFQSTLFCCIYSIGIGLGMTVTGAMSDISLGWDWIMTIYAVVSFTLLMAVVVVKLQELSKKCMQMVTDRNTNNGDEKETLLLQ